ncbi:MAG: hypothetical protein COB02_05940 [Candidatus Cloacimonadota bacterium]|nr:MAG: hypothetical protein COB02_12150 [Candidatus Cloacimonadota bacterium]PCJ20139.1 MAG: hypothetical protein COB02_05940 [Candidatus Cloacimonadota bacterium]
MTLDKYHFVYNANTGWLTEKVDLLHKILSPSTYSCNLCVLTHGAIHEKESLNSFRKNHPNQIFFYHKDQNLMDCMKQGPFPAIWKESKGQTQLLIGPKEISKFKDIKNLVDFLDKDMDT